MSNGFGRWGKQTFAGIIATPVILSVVQQNNTVSADESMTWWVTKNVLRLAGVAVATFAVKKLLGSKNKSGTKIENSEKVKSNSNNGQVAKPAILFVNNNKKRNPVDKKEEITFNKLFKKARNKKKPIKKCEKLENKNNLYKNSLGKKEESEKEPLYKGFLRTGEFLKVLKSVKDAKNEYFEKYVKESNEYYLNLLKKS